MILGFRAVWDRTMGENSVDRRFFLNITATSAIGLALSPTRVFAQAPATSAARMSLLHAPQLAQRFLTSLRSSPSGLMHAFQKDTMA